uniref:Uncharacterized protein n=1 Tax=Romanomermis culicivorax TaxID=13658 RepID=A0A915KWV8_ROMCU
MKKFKQLDDSALILFVVFSVRALGQKISSPGVKIPSRAASTLKEKLSYCGGKGADGRMWSRMHQKFTKHIEEKRQIDHHPGKPTFRGKSAFGRHQFFMNDFSNKKRESERSIPGKAFSDQILPIFNLSYANGTEDRISQKSCLKTLFTHHCMRCHEPLDFRTDLDSWHLDESENASLDHN